MQTTFNWLKAYHKFIVYLPVIILSIFIMLIYFSYVFTYILVLTNTPEKLEINTFVFNHTSNPSSAYSKGVGLLISTTYSLIMLLISMARTIFIDPGYFPSPVEFEYKIILKNTKFKPTPKKEDPKSSERINYIGSFGQTIQEGPLCSSDANKIRNEITRHIGGDEKREFAEIDQRLYYNIDNEDALINVEEPDHKDDLYNKFKGIDMAKAILCGTCLRWKAERSHHCRQCGRCVLKMDHHCPWLANCIGFRNYKFFCLIHFYGVISTSIIALSYWEVVINHNLNYDKSLFEVLYCFFIYISNLSLFSFLAWLFYSNVKLIFSGLTIIENSDRERFPSKTINIYNLGYYKNFVAVFGTNPLVWFIPFFPNTIGDGIIFQTNINK